MTENQKNHYNSLDLFGGEKGGVGKTFVAKTAIQYQIDRGYNFIGFVAKSFDGQSISMIN